MLTLFVFSLCFSGKTIVLDYAKPIGMSIQSTKRLVGERLFLADDYSVLCFDLDGKLTMRYGRKGEGPGELQYISGFGLSGDGILGILDGMTQFISLFDQSSGRFLKRCPARALELIPDQESGRMFLLDLKAELLNAHVNENASLVGYALPALREYQFQRDCDVPRRERFHIPSETVSRWNFNDRRHWVRLRGGAFFVIDELSPQLSEYDATSRQKRAVSPLALPGFVPAPEAFAAVAKMTNDEYRDWWYSFSRFLDFNLKEDRYLFTYLVPALDETAIYRYQTVLMDRDWNVQKKITQAGHYRSERFYVESDGEFYGFIADVGRDIFPVYEVLLHPW